MDYLVRAIDEAGNIRVFLADTSNLVERARQIHQTSATASAAMGRSLTAGLLMGSMMKNESDVLTLRIDGGGPLGKMVITANSKGDVKGYVSNPSADLELRQDGKLDVSGIVGREGQISVSMDLGLKEPYVGHSDIISGEIAEDIAAYYAISEQQPTAVSLGVLVDKDLSIKAAGGFIIQLLPGVRDEDIDRIEKALAEIAPISSLIDKGIVAEEIIENLLGDFKMKIIAKEDIAYSCDCSLDRVKKTISSLPSEDIKSLIEEDKGAELICHFCGEKHLLSIEDLEKILIDKE